MEKIAIHCKYKLLFFTNFKIILKLIMIQNDINDDTHYLLTVIELIVI